MRFLLDENLWRDAFEALLDLGHDVAWVRLDAPGLPDEDVLALAVREKFTLITSDKDFGGLVFRRGLRADHGVILLRMIEPIEVKTALLIKAIQMRSDWSGQFAVVESGRIRIRPLPPIA